MPGLSGRAPGGRAARRSMIPSDGREGETVIQLGELVMILDLHRQGLGVSAIARRVGIDRKTVRKYIERGLEPPSYGPRQPRARRREPFEAYLRQRIAAYPGLTASRLLREIREHGYTAVTEGFRWSRSTASSIAPADRVSTHSPCRRCARIQGVM